LDEELGEAACSNLTELGIEARSIRCDLSRPEEAEGLAGQVVDDAGRIDILVNNARGGRRAGLDDESPENWGATMSVVLQAAFFTSRRAITAMSAHGNGSVVSDTVSNESPSYHAAKGGLVQLTRFLAVHAAPRGVRVNAVSPGFIVQSQHKKRFEEDGNSEYRRIAEFAHPVPRVGTETDVARLSGSLRHRKLRGSPDSACASMAVSTFARRAMSCLISRIGQTNNPTSITVLPSFQNLDLSHATNGLRGLDA